MRCLLRGAWALSYSPLPHENTPPHPGPNPTRPRGATHGGHRRPPQGLEQPLLCGALGALLVLRDAGLVNALHDRPDGGRRPGLHAAAGVLGLRQLCHVELHALHPRRLHRGQFHRRSPGGAYRGLHHHRRTLHPRAELGGHLLRRPRPHRGGHRPPQAEHQYARRRTLCPHRCAARRRLLAFLHGHQHRGLRRALSDRLPRTR